MNILVIIIGFIALGVSVEGGIYAYNKVLPIPQPTYIPAPIVTPDWQSTSVWPWQSPPVNPWKPWESPINPWKWEAPINPWKPWEAPIPSPWKPWEAPTPTAPWNNPWMPKWK